MKKCFILLTLVVTSCSFLNKEPKDFISESSYYKTQSQLESALNGVYASMAETGVYCNYMQGRMGLSADLGYNAYSIDKNTVAWNVISTTDAKISAYWKALYRGIGNANMLLRHVDDPEIHIEDSERIRIKGEAQFLRAYYYYMLAVRFGGVPLVLDVPASSDATDVQIPRSSLQEVYDFVIEDMKAAVEMVKPASELTGGGQVSQSAVCGILARVGLSMAGYPLNNKEGYSLAKEYAGKVIATESHELNSSYENIFINLIQDKYDIKECIFEVEFWGNNEGEYTTTAGKVGVNNGIRYIEEDLAATIGASVGAIRATDAYYKMFEKGDLRRDWTIAPYYIDASTGVHKSWSSSQIWNRFCGKWRREYELTDSKSTSFNSTNFPILRYADVLLMYAEAVACDPDASIVDLNEGYTYLNQVRRRGFGLPIGTTSLAVDVPNGGAQELLDAVKKERPRELGYELLRKDDLIRWGEFYDAMKDVASTVPQSTSSIYVSARTAFNTISERDVLWPIPSYEMGLNRKLTQNEGW